MAVAELSVDRGWVGVELRHLTALAAIARTNSFVRAARSLGYTQSAISAQIAALERAVGVQLISRARGSRFVHLTAEGEILLAHAAVVTSELERARARLSERIGGESAAAVRLAAPRSLAPLLPPLLALLRREAPSVSVLVRELDEERSLTALEHRETHLCLTAVAPLAAARLEGRHVATDPFVLIAPDLPDASTASTDLDLLAWLPLAAPASGDAAKPLDDLFARARLHPSFVLRTDDAAALNAVAREKVAAAVLPRLLVEPDLLAYALPLDRLLEPREISIAWPAGETLGATTRVVISAATRVGETRSLRRT
jgi:DNA-binding transcriptional LysR family regulator